MTDVKQDSAKDSASGLLGKLGNASISFKILMVTQVTTILVLLVSAIVSFNLSRDAIEVKILDQLTSVREIKGQQIENYIDTIERQIITYSSSPAVVDAVQVFRNAFDKISVSTDRSSSLDADAFERLNSYYRDEFFNRLEPNIKDKSLISSTENFIPKDSGSIRLQQMFISDNPRETGQKHELDSVDRSLYSVLHEQYHPVIREYLDKFGYYDIFLVDHITGKIVYSVFKEVDFATSLLTGPYKDTNFAEAFDAARQAEDPDFVNLVDFEPYVPSFNAPASFIASPIFDGDTKVGVLVFQMPIDRINDIMTSNQAWESVGLGKSGETYVVGQDFTMRNQSRFLIEDPDSFHTVIGNAPFS